MLLRAEWVVPVSRTPVRDGCVAISEGRVTWVGGHGETGRPSGPVRDLGLGVLLPGLVNAHTHLELSHLRGTDRSGGFVAWIERLVETRWTYSTEAIRSATRDAIAFLERETGTVAVADVSNALDHLQALADSRLDAVVFYELLGLDPAKAEDVLAGAADRLGSLPAGLEQRGVDVRLAAHAPHSVSRPLFAGLARRRGPAAIHLAESPAETRFLATGEGEWRDFIRRRGIEDVPYAPPGVSPVRFAEGLGILRPGFVAAHCVQVDAADREILARSGVSVAICLTSNRNLGVGVPPVPEMLAAGVRLCVGTDSLASGDGLDVLGELVALHRQFPQIDPAQFVAMVTSGGAQALGRADLGAIEPGRRAALAFAAARGPVGNPLEFLVSGEARLRPVEGVS